MPLRENTFEGGSDGVAISAANSGGASGDAFTSVFGTGSKYANSPARGAMAMELVDPGGETGVRWTGLALGTADVWTRCYVYLTAYPVTNQVVVMRGQTAVNANNGGVAVTTGGKIRAINAGGVPIGTEGTVAVALNQWVRIEMRLKAGLASTGEIEWRLFNTADAHGADEDQAIIGTTLAADTDGIRYGSLSVPPAAPFTVGYDDVALDATDWIGPRVPPMIARVPRPVLITG